jgi:hypothetical protein
MRLTTLDPHTISRQLYICGGLCDTTSAASEREALPVLPQLDNGCSSGTVNILPRAIPPAQRQPAHLTWNATAAHVNGSKETGKGVNLLGLLQMLYHDSRFTNFNSWKNVIVPQTLGTPSMVTNALELCQCVMREEDLDQF